MRTRLPPILIGLCLLLGLLTGCEAGDTPRGTAPAAATMPPIIPNPAPVLTKRDMSATKEARDQAERGAVATLIASGTPIVITPLPIPTDKPIPTPILGLSGYGGDADNYFNHTDVWRGLVDNEYVYVNAGAPWDNQAQGTLLVITRTLDLQTYGRKQLFPTPARAGLIRIVEVLGSRLTIRGEDGTLFYFDVATRQWVDPPSTTTIPAQTPTLTRAEMDATKVARYDQQRQEWGAMATSIAQGTPFVYTPIPIPTTPPRPPHVLGLYSGCADPDPYYTYRSCWAGLGNNEYLFVSSGAIKSDPPQGMVRVYTTTLDQETRGPELTYTTPRKAGLVRIINAVGQRLTLRTDIGTRFYFDVATRQWVNP